MTVISVDSDGLKKINDTLDHHMGDRAIQYLGRALAQSIRKSDYGIRLGGDEFSLILIDYSLAKSHEVINRIQAYLAGIDEDKMVAFSYGSYQLVQGNTLETALLKADELLYQHKRNKYGKNLPADNGLSVKALVDMILPLWHRPASRRIVKGIQDKDYGLRAFVLADPNGNRIDVGQRLTK